MKHKKAVTPGGVIENCDFTQAVFTGTIKRVMFKNCDFRAANFSKATLKSVQFSGCNFRGTKLPYQELNSIDYRETTGNHNKNPVNWNLRNLDRVKYNKNAPGMNPDRLSKKRQGKKQKKRTKWQY